MRNQSIYKFIIVTALTLSAQSALADGAIIAEKGGCLMCHTAEKKMLVRHLET